MSEWPWRFHSCCWCNIQSQQPLEFIWNNEAIQLNCRKIFTPKVVVRIRRHEAKGQSGHLLVPIDPVVWRNRKCCVDDSGCRWLWLMPFECPVCTVDGSGRAGCHRRPPEVVPPASSQRVRYFRPTFEFFSGGHLAALSSSKSGFIPNNFYWPNSTFKTSNLAPAIFLFPDD